MGSIPRLGRFPRGGPGTPLQYSCLENPIDRGAWQGIYSMGLQYSQTLLKWHQSVQFTRSLVSNSLQPHGLQRARPPCPSPTPRASSNSCPSSWWCHPTISSSVVPFSSCLQSFPAPRSFQMSQLSASGGQSIGASASASLLPVNIQDWFPLGWTVGSPCSPRDSQSLLQHHNSKASILWRSAFSMVQLSHQYMTIEKTIALTKWIFVGKVMSLLFNMLFRFLITFLPRSKCLLISWPKSPSAVILEPKKIVCHSFHCFPIYLSWSDGTGCHDLCFFNVEF